MMKSLSQMLSKQMLTRLDTGLVSWVSTYNAGFEIIQLTAATAGPSNDMLVDCCGDSQGPGAASVGRAQS